MVRGGERTRGGKARGPDPDYEEIQPRIPKQDLDDAPFVAPNCDLCGSNKATVRCDKCNNQAFCLACDDMYHRHPRRSTHIRKAVEERRNQDGFVRPPLPPKGNELLSPPPPQPPPRKNKRLFLPANTKNEQIFNSGGGRGSYRSAMGNRPLPPTPNSGKGILTKAESTGNLALFNNSGNHYGANLNKKLPPLTLPRAIQDINLNQEHKISQSVPPTPPSGHSQYPPLQPKPVPGQTPPQSNMKGRKFSLQQLPFTYDEKRASMVEAPSTGTSWEPPQLENGTQKMRSQSISDTHWNQVVAVQGKNDPQSGAPCLHNRAGSDIGIPPHPASKGYNARQSNAGRGMVSSASVSDLNALTHFHPQQYPGNMQSANSFQQMNMMRYDGNMMWMASCPLCQPQSAMFSGQPGAGMKRTTSNISMNMSSAASDVPPGYHPHWGHHHMHAHHMPMYPGYYPGYHPHMMPNMSMHGSSMSIPDSMHSPAPSVMSSHRSRKSSKSGGSFRSGKSNSHRSRNRSSRRSEESEESGSFTGSEEDDEEVFSKGYKQNASWQCDHCTFINPGHAQTCGMCSKTLGYSRDKGPQRGMERRKSERDLENEQNIPDFVGGNKSRPKSRGSRSLRSESIKSNSSKRRNKSRVRSSSRSVSPPLSESDDRRLIEKQLQELRITPRNSSADYEGISISSRGRKHDKRGHYKREGGVMHRSHSRGHSARPCTPGRELLCDDSAENRSRSSYSFSDDSEEMVEPIDSGESSGEPPPNRSSQDGTDRTLVPTISSVLKKLEEDHLMNEDDHSRPKENEAEVGSEPEEEEEEEIEDEAHIPDIILEGNADEELEEEVSRKIEELVSQTLKAPVEERPLTPKDAKGEVDDPSFANTLDDVDTMATNEIADIDTSCHSNEKVNEIEISPEDLYKVINPLLGATEDGKESSNQMQLDNEEFFEKILFDNKTTKEDPEPELRHEDLEKRASGESYEQIEEPTKTRTALPQDLPDLETTSKVEKAADKTYESISVKEQNKDVASVLKNEFDKDETVRPAQFLQKPSNVAESFENRNKSPSLESFQGKFSSTPDRQCTPLSFSSSDAQFYSPPDTPDLLLSGRLREKFSSEPQGLDSLGKELEDEAGSESTSEAPSLEHDDPYRTVSFEDALAPQDFPLAKSASDQAISSRIQLIDTVKEPLDLGNQKPDAIKHPPTAASSEIDEKYLSVKELITRRKQKAMKEQGLELVQLLRQAEDQGYNPEEVSIALTLCGDKTPLEWLQDNWGHMVDTVMTLATNSGQERKFNDIGEVTSKEAASALRLHKGNIWAAVTECVEERQKGYSEIHCRGKFKREDILGALKESEGSSEDAYFQLNKTQQLGSFFKKIWTPAENVIESASKLYKGAPEDPKEVREEEDIPQQDGPAIYENVDETELEDEDEDSKAQGIYSNLFAPLMQRIGDSLQRAGASMPRMSEDFKRKFTQAVLEWETNPTLDRYFFDSQDESTIEELLAVAESPSFYEYFTAVDMDDDEESESEGTTDHKQQIDSPQPEEPSFVAKTTEEAVEPKTRISPPKKKIDDEVQYIRKEDVVFHPLKSFGHYAVMHYADEERDSEALLTATRGEDLEPTQDHHQRSTADVMRYPENEESLDENSLNVVVHEVQDNSIVKSSFAISKESFDEAANVEKPQREKNIGAETLVKEREVKVAREDAGQMGQEQVEDDEEEEEEIEEEEEVEEEEEEEEEEEREEEEEEREEEEEEREEEDEAKDTDEEEESLNVTTGRLSLSFTQTSSKEANIDVKAQTIQTQQMASSSKQERENASSTSSTDKKEAANQSIIETKELYKGSGPVTVQKATLIVGKAIAKAMARETTVKDQVSDQADQEPTEEKVKEQEEIYSSSEYDSDTDDDLARSLDTIPEEETRSRSRTQSQQSSEVKDGPVGKGGAPSRPPAVASFSGPIFIPSKTPSSVKPNSKDVAGTSKTTKISSPSPALSKAQLKSDSSLRSTSAAPSKESNLKPTKEIVTPVKSPSDKPLAFKPTSSYIKEQQRLLHQGKDAKVTPNVPTKDAKGEPPPQQETLRDPKAKVSQPTKGEAADDSTQSKIGQGASAKTSLTSIQSRLKPKQTRSAIDSSGESDEEDRMIDDLKTKGKELDIEEVEDLKEQIKMLKEELGIQIPLGETSVDLPEASQGQEEGESKDQTQEFALQDREDEASPNKQIETEEDEQLKFDRTVRRVLAEGQVREYEKAEIVAHLLNLSFDESDSIAAAEECSSIYTAVKFLRQDCEICAEKYPMAKMVSMLHCTHRCCYDCANNYFSYQIKAKNIRELSCPFCSEPDLDSCEEVAAEYLNNLDILLKGIIDEETHELFQRKLRDWTLMKEPNFRWCNKCSSGFIANPRARKLICPDCKNITCAQCRTQWEPQHEGISCEAFSKWKEENNPETQAEGVAKHLAECGITCPKCKFTYSLAKGGCMHFTCTECKYEFCSGCGQAFKQGAKCPVGSYCERLGLHAHHPRNCLFYLRDKEPIQLQQLLKENDVPFNVDPDEGWEGSTRKHCRVQEQKETVEGLKDDLCGRAVLEGHAGLCRVHYIEYLVEKINSHGLDPVSIFDEADLRVCLRRNGKAVPPRRWESEKLYRDKLTQLIRKELPLA